MAANDSQVYQEASYANLFSELAIRNHHNHSDVCCRRYDGFSSCYSVAYEILGDITMRDWLVLLIVAGALPLILVRPYIGVLVWSWLGYMNPHRLTWGFAYDFPFAQIVGVTTLIGLLFCKERKGFSVTAMIGIWLTFVLWMNISTLFSLVPESAWPEWDRTMKIQLFSIVTLILMRSKVRIKYLVWTIVACLAFFGVKGGIFSILTGGNYLVWGPAGSFIEGNNSLGVAMVMIMPLMWYLVLQAEQKYVRLGLYAAMGLTALAILATHSRGAFLAIAAMLGFVWLKSRKKGWLAVALIVCAPLFWFAMPPAWQERMTSISEYQQDGSAMGRINAWEFAFNLAKDRPLTGGGFSAFTPELFEKYAPDPEDFHDAHSIYFEVLGEHGFVGLFLFLLLGIMAFREAGKVSRRARASPELGWVVDLGAMLQASLVGYAVGGAFLGLAYFDLYYHLVVLIALLRVVSADEIESVTFAESTESSGFQRLSHDRPPAKRFQ